jgi:hypothetical protein
MTRKTLVTHIQLVAMSMTIFFMHGSVHAATDQFEIITPPGTSGYTFNTVAAIGNYVYLGTDNGVYKSTDGGTTWNQINTGLSSNLDITSIAIGWVYSNGAYRVNPSTPVFIGTAEGGVFAGTIGGSSWTATSTGLTDLHITDLEIDQYQATQGTSTNLYVATPSGIFISTNTGSNWQLDNSGFSGVPQKIATAFVSEKIYALNNSNVLYESDLHSSSGSYASWSTNFNANGTTTNDISILHPVGNIGWLATDKGIYKSDDMGTAWASTSIGLPSRSVKNVASDYQDSNISYSAVYGDGVYRTINEAIPDVDPLVPVWLPINLNLTDLNINQVQTDPSSSLYVYALGTNTLSKLTYSDTMVGAIDLTPPSDVTDLGVSLSDQSIPVLSWTAPGNDMIYGTSSTYSIRYSTSNITEGNFSSATEATPEKFPWGNGRAESYPIFGLVPGSTYYFALKASDDAGHSSALSNVVSVALLPPQVSTQAVSSLGETTATFNGTLASNSATTTEQGFVYGTSLPYTATTSSSGEFSAGPFLTVMTDAFSCETTYHYAAYATNGFGSGYGSDSQFTTSACTDTTAPTITSFVASNSDSTTITISSFTATDDVAVSGYLINESAVAPSTLASGWSSTAQTTYTTSGEGTFTLYAWTKDSSGHVSTAASQVVVVTFPEVSDTTPPTAPTSLTATAVSSSQINLEWSASTDDRGVSSYRIYREGVHVGTASGVTYSDTGLAASTAYSYYIVAYDAATNPSDQSSPASATTHAASVTPTEEPAPRRRRGGGGGGSRSVVQQTIAPTLTPSAPTLPAIPVIYATLRIGSRSPLVVSLQKFLNEHGAIIASTGAGSPGKETEYYGALTDVAVKRYIQMVIASTPASSIQGTILTAQPVAYPYRDSIFRIGTSGAAIKALQTYLSGKGYMPKTSITSFYGPVTDAAFQRYKKDMSVTAPTPTTCPAGMICQPATSTTVQPLVPIATTLPAFTKQLSLNSRGPEVKNLQRFLNSRGYIIATVGVGSLGKESDLFGPATQAALTRFQKAHAVQIFGSSGVTTGLGSFGPGTLRVVNSLLGY